MAAPKIGDSESILDGLDRLSRRDVLKAAGGMTLSTGMLGMLTACGGSSGGAAKTKSVTWGFELAQIPPLDPHAPISGTARQVVLPMFEGLVAEDLTRDDVISPVVPALAESLSSSDGGRVWEFKLRKGVKFHDGTPFDADAAIWNIRRVFDPDSPQYSAEAQAANALYFPGSIADFEKIDAQTFSLAIPDPFPVDEQFYQLLMISPTAFEEKGLEGFVTSPVGTGQFKFGKLRPGVSLELVRNDDYWGEKAKLDLIVMQPIADPLARASALRAGEIDIALELSPDTLDGLKSAKKQVLTSARSHTWHYMFNMRQAPYTDKRVRQALNFAIDRDRITKDILRDTATPMICIADKGSPFYDDSLPAYTYDPERAKSLLAEAGYAKGFRTTWWTATNGSGNLVPLPMSEFIQSNLRDVGVNVDLKKFDFSGEFFEPFSKGIRPSVDAYQSSYSSDKPFWWIAFSKDGIPPGQGGLNVGFYDNAECNRLYRRMISSQSEDERTTLVKEMQRIVWDDAPWLFVVHGNNIRVLSERIKGFVDAQSWMFPFETIEV